MGLTQPYDTQNLYCGAQTLNFLQIHWPFTDSVVVGPAKSARFSVAEANLHRLNYVISVMSSFHTVEEGKQ